MFNKTSTVMSPQQLVIALELAGFDMYDISRCRELIGILESDGSKVASEALEMSDEEIQSLVKSLWQSIRTDDKEKLQRQRQDEDESRKLMTVSIDDMIKQQNAEKKERDRWDKIRNKWMSAAQERYNSLVLSMPNELKSKPGWEKLVPTIEEIILALENNKIIGLKSTDETQQSMIDRTNQIAKERGLQTDAPAVSKVKNLSDADEVKYNLYGERLDKLLKSFMFEFMPPHPGMNSKLTDEQIRQNNAAQLAHRQSRGAIDSLVKKIDDISMKTSGVREGTALYEAYRAKFNERGAPEEAPNLVPVNVREVKKQERAENRDNIKQEAMKLKALLNAHPWGFEVSTYMPRTIDEIKRGMESLKQIKELVSKLDAADTKHHRLGTTMFKRHIGGGRYFSEVPGGTLDGKYLDRIREYKRMYSSGQSGGESSAPVGQLSMSTDTDTRTSVDDDDKLQMPSLDEMIQNAGYLDVALKSDKDFVDSVLSGVRNMPPGKYESDRPDSNARREEITDSLIERMTRLAGDTTPGQIEWGFELERGVDDPEYKKNVASFRALQHVVSDLDSLWVDRYPWSEDPGGQRGGGSYGNDIFNQLIQYFWESPRREKLAREYGGLYADKNAFTIDAISAQIGNSAISMPVVAPGDELLGGDKQELDKLLEEHIGKPEADGSKDLSISEDDILRLLDSSDAAAAKGESETVDMKSVDNKLNIVDEESASGDVKVLETYENDDDKRIAYENYNEFISSSPASLSNDAVATARLNALKKTRSKFVGPNGSPAVVLPSWLPDIDIGQARAFVAPSDPGQDAFLSRNKDVVKQYAEQMNAFVMSDSAKSRFMPIERGGLVVGTDIYERGKSDGGVPSVKVHGGDFIIAKKSTKPHIIGVDAEGNVLDPNDSNAQMYAILMPDGTALSGKSESGGDAPMLFQDKRECATYFKSSRQVQNAKPIVEKMEGMVVGKSVDGGSLYILRPARDSNGNYVSKIDSVNVINDKVEPASSQAPAKKQGQAVNVGDYVRVNGGPPSKIEEVNGSQVTIKVNNQNEIADTSQPSVEVVPNAEARQQGGTQQQTTQPSAQPAAQPTSMSQAQTNAQQSAQTQPITMDDAIQIPTAAGGPNMIGDGNGSRVSPGPNVNSLQKAY